MSDWIQLRRLVRQAIAHDTRHEYNLLAERLRDIRRLYVPDDTAMSARMLDQTSTVMRRVLDLLNREYVRRGDR